MLTRLFCDIDDFCQDFIPQWEATLLESGQKKRNRTRSVSQSEIITLVVYFHKIGYRTFKWFYQRQVIKHMSSEFPTLPSYLDSHIEIPNSIKALVV